MVHMTYAAVMAVVLMGASGGVDAFMVGKPSRVLPVASRRSRSSLQMNQQDDRLDKSSVDWDNEWKKIATAPREAAEDAADKVEEKVPQTASPSRPRGLDDMSELERSTLRASRRVQGLGQQAVRKVENLSKSSKKKIKSVTPKGKVKVPSWKRLSKDWRFWVGMLAVASFGTSLIAAVSQMGGETDLII